MREDVDTLILVDEIAEKIDRERSTAYRSVQRLMQAGFIQKQQVNYDHGGYYHVYRPRDGDEIAQEMQRMLNDWYAQMDSSSASSATSTRPNPVWKPNLFRDLSQIAVLNSFRPLSSSGTSR
ncbi:sugar-specific transcriptional regulator TrmB [Halohasta litchfieldiae]|uniref:Sugar-specific transcriptional regulator TrmB n=1 Tax=Halohasta litchfieldiae TaxID=1073996 RepID=A0A1H6WBJ2_9EURY|nr:sugar-specific transcriptional regulator TrmB [Halohasta litchfieldiae]SEJ11427.1 Sugar-specific transcriptional regulator TrmB [Halohasta litchfieldiae]